MDVRQEPAVSVQLWLLQPCQRSQCSRKMPFCFQFFARTGYDRREMEREFSHLVEKRRPNRGGAPPVGQCRMLRVLRLHSALSCRAARGDTAASAAPAWSNRAAVLGNLCATEECCWERSLTPGFLQRVRGELLQTHLNNTGTV